MSVVEALGALAAPGPVRVTVRLDAAAAATLAALTAGRPRDPALRELLARDLLAVTSLTDRAVLLYAPRDVPRGGAKLKPCMTPRLRDLVARRAAALGVAQAVYLGAVLGRAAAQLAALAQIRALADHVDIATADQVGCWQAKK